MKRKLLTTLMGAVFCLNLGKGQGQEAYKCWLETQTIDGKRTISSWVLNNTPNAARLFYEATLRTDGKEIVKNGSTLTLPGQPNLLLKAIFVLQDDLFEKITLTVKDHEKTVAAATLSGAPALADLPPGRTDPLTPPPTAALSFNDLEIEGLVIDETRSKLAHDFYELFYNNWSAMETPPGNYTITIGEVPARIGIGARVSVAVDGEELTQLNLQPRADVLENLAAQLSDSLVNYLTAPGNNTRQLDADDLDGTGIY